MNTLVSVEQLSRMRWADRWRIPLVSGKAVADNHGDKELCGINTLRLTAGIACI